MVKIKPNENGKSQNFPLANRKALHGSILRCSIISFVLAVKAIAKLRNRNKMKGHKTTPTTKTTPNEQWFLQPTLALLVGEQITPGKPRH